MSIRVGLTGGIGSGKSTVAAQLAEYGAAVVDADAVARDLQQPGSALLDAMAAEFGGGIIDADGALDRAAVASLVFGDTEEATRRRDRLNAITGPPIAAEIDRRLAAAAEHADIVVLDHPLLAERMIEGLDAVVVVDVPVDVQVRRLVDGRGMSETDARNRIASQATRDARRAIATFLIDNAGSFESLEPQVRSLWDELVALNP